MVMPDFKALRRTIPIEAVIGQRVRLRRQGRALVGRCPFHDDRGRPNLTVYPDTQTYICYVCRAHGDAVDFVARLEGLTQGQAARKLGERAPASRDRRPPLRAASPRDPDHLDLVYRMTLGALSLSERHREDLLARGLTEEAIHARAYRTLGSDEDRRRVVETIRRGLSEDAMRQVPGFGIQGGGWTLAAPEGLFIPVLDARGRIVGIQVRTADPRRKYRWLSTPSLTAGASSGSPAHVANPGREGAVWITEGPLKADVLAARLGLRAVAVPGVAAWRKALPVVQELRPPSAVLAFDQDEDPATAMAVGRHTRDLARTLRRTLGLGVRVASWERGKGVDDALALGAEIRVEALP